MAEAHQAVAFSFSLHEEGLDVNVDIKVLQEVFSGGVRNYRKRLARYWNDFKCGVYPSSPSSYLLILAIVLGCAAMNVDVSAGFIGKIQKWFQNYFDANASQYVACTFFAFIIWILVIYSIRFSLRTLLRYHGWMFEPFGRMSMFTRVWLGLLRIMKGHKPMLMSYQGSLPSLPVPSLDDTMRRYLKSARPLLDDEEYADMEKLAKEFQRGLGKKLQKYLWLKSWWATNYVSDWWEEYVYLRPRAPIMVNSNFYALDAVITEEAGKAIGSVASTQVQVARAANVIHSLFLFRREVQRQKIQPIMINNVIPLCSGQYERIFNTTRLPGMATDVLKHWQESQHIVVYHRGRFFKFTVYRKGRLLNPCELEVGLEKIIDDPSPPQQGEARIPALTAGERTVWAQARDDFFTSGVNRASLNTIEKAAFFVTLDDEEHDYDPADSSRLDNYAHFMLCGNGTNRWFDKSFTLVVMKNAKIGLNAEHSWADAPITSHFWEFIMVQDLIKSGYDVTGHTLGKPAYQPTPIRLQWNITPPCEEVIDSCHKTALNLLNDVDLRLLNHNEFGKGLMKKCKVSPDAFIQMALQLAYFRDIGQFHLTYEASMTRLYRDGRTETVRPVTQESCEFVRSMQNKNVSREDRLNLFKQACEVHAHGYKNAMAGKGIDRHLFCLYVVSKYLGAESPFLVKVLNEPWRLSTSQTPHGQMKRDKNMPHYISAGGGFGPVANDGYGVSYIIAGEAKIFFHISSKKSSPKTDSNRMRMNIKKALSDIKNLCLA